jgi:benzoyl-CoA reductase/2-hydroxyglutaryl-CoA dehydratase subunit BcrC/BadD/HgdB
VKTTNDKTWREQAADEIARPTRAASFIRLALLAERRVAAARSGTGKSYLEYQALKASLGAFEPGAIVPWVSYMFPPEVLTAYGLTPFIPEVAATVVAGSDFRPRLDGAMNRLPLARDVCSYHRAALAALDAGLLPPPSLCLGTTSLCMGKERLLDSLARRFDVPFLELRVPEPPDEGPAASYDVAELTEQLRDVYSAVGRLTARRPDLHRAVVRSNRATAAWRSLAEQRAAGTLQLDGRQTFALTFIAQIVWGTEAGARGFEKLLTEKGRRDLLPPAGLNGDTKRLLWLHVFPRDDDGTYTLMRDHDTFVAFEEVGQVRLEPLDPDDPFPGLARRMIEHPLWGSAARRAREVLDLARATNVDGVVHYNHLGCRQALGSVPAIRQTLVEAGLPFIAFDGDALAHAGNNEGQGHSEFESFLELL